MKNRPQLAAVWVCSLVAVCGCSQSTETVSDGGGTIPPVAVPLAEPTPTASETPVTASITNEADKLLAEEAFFVASAKALAFSREVQTYRQRYYESLAKQFGNQAVQNNVLPQPGQSRRPRHRRTILNLSGGPTSGDIAGEEYLKNEAKRLNDEAQEYLTKTDLAIQQEAWRRLSESDRVLVAKFDLIPKEVRDAAEESRVPTEANEKLSTANNPPVLAWSSFSIPDSDFQIDFPSTVSNEPGDGAIRYGCAAASVIFSVEWPTESLSTPGLSDEQILIKETEGIAAAQSQQGKSVARRTAKLGDYPAEELCVFYKQDRRELATYARFAIIDGKFVSAQVNDLDANDEQHSQRFLNSFRRKAGDQR